MGTNIDASPARLDVRWTCRSVAEFKAASEKQAELFGNDFGCCCGIAACAMVRNAYEDGLSTQKLDEDDVIADHQLEATGMTKEVRVHVLDGRKTRRRTRSNDADLQLARCHWFNSDVKHKVVQDSKGNTMRMDFEVKSETTFFKGKTQKRVRKRWNVEYKMAPPCRLLSMIQLSPTFLAKLDAGNQGVGRASRRRTLVGAKRMV